MRVAVMQPYFFPYMLYYHLIASVDLFVLFDCVQFPRRGRVHRAPLPQDRWLTLPLARQDRATRIADLQFAPEADEAWPLRLAVLRWLTPELRASLSAPFPGEVCTYLSEQLADGCQRLSIETKLVRSSTLGLDPALRAQDRVIAAAKSVGARDYINLPGGRSLYDPDAFAAAGLTLSFLPAYEGKNLSMLNAFATAPVEDLRAELQALPPPERVTP